MSRLQFNLLPDIKLDYIKAQQTKRIVFLTAIAVSSAALVLLAIMFMSVKVIQKKQLSDADKDIKKYSEQLRNIEDLDKILTVQNQLNVLPGLHDKKHYTSRIFTYLPALTPDKVNVGRLQLIITDNTLLLVGTADSLQTVNKFVDTLKFTDYKTDDKSEAKKAFKSVVLESFGKDDKGASYTIKVEYEPILFEGKNAILLKVPAGFTSRSVTEGPKSSLFDGQLGDQQPQNVPGTTNNSGGQR